MKKYTGIILAAIMVVSVFAVIAPSVSALPQGDESKTLNTVNVTFGTYNVSGSTYTPTGNGLGEGTTDLWTHVVTYDLNTSDGLLGLTVTYKTENGSLGTVDVNYTDNQSVCYWMSDTVTDLVNVTSIVQTSGGTLISGDIDFIATVDRVGLEQDVGDSDDALGGFITDLDFNVNQRTDKWQGYLGNLSGTIYLKDSSGHTMISWSWSTNTTNAGEVYATTNGTIPSWHLLDDNYPDAGEIDTAFNLEPSGDQSDNATKTFATTTHTAFDVQGNSIEAAPTAKTNNDVPTAIWETVALAFKDSPTAAADFVFAGIARTDQTAYNGNTVDYQMIVPEDPTDESGTTAYYFYVELK